MTVANKKERSPAEIVPGPASVSVLYDCAMKPDFSGTWTADLSKSTFAGPKPASLLVVVEHRDPEFRQELVVTKADGSTDRAVFGCQIGDEGTLLFNGSQLRGAAKWVGDELMIESWVRIGERELYFCDCWSLSPDGQRLTMEHRNDALAGQRVECQRVP